MEELFFQAHTLKEDRYLSKGARTVTPPCPLCKAASSGVRRGAGRRPPLPAVVAGGEGGGRCKREGGGEVVDICVVMSADGLNVGKW